MEPIASPLGPPMRGPAVVALQAALQVLLDTGSILADDEDLRRSLAEALPHERAEAVYGEVTSQVVDLVRAEHDLGPGNDVDERTADVLNTLLREQGHTQEAGGDPSARVGHLADLRPFGSAGPTPEPTRTRATKVIKSPLRPGDRGSDVAALIGTLLQLIDRGDLSLPPESPLPSAAQSELATRSCGPATAELVTLFRDQHGLGAGDEVDESTAIRLSELASGMVVRGVVHTHGGTAAEGVPWADVVVRAFDYDVEGGRQLGEAVTDAAGQYRITIDPDIKPSEVALFVGVMDQDRLVERSRVVFQPGMVTTINVGVQRPTVRTAPSEFERLIQVVAPRLRGRELRELSADQAAVLEQDERTSPDEVQAGIESSRIIFDASALAERAGLTIGDLDLPLVETVYALVRELPGLDLQGVLASGSTTMVAAVERAVTSGRIRPEVGEQVDQVSGLLRSLRIARRLEPAAPDEPASLGDLLRTLPTDQQLNDADQWAVSELLDGVTGATANWSREKLEPVERTLVLGAITAGNAALVQAMNRPDDGGEVSLRQVASLDRADWRRLVAEHGVPSHLDVPAESPELYVDQLLRNVERELPSLHIATRIDDGRLPLGTDAAPAVVRYLENAATFRIGEHPVLGRLAEPEEHDFDEIAEESRPEVQQALLRVERVIRVSDTLESAQHLIAAGYESARQVSLVHRTRFVEEFGEVLPGGAAAAEEIHAKACGATATATGFLLAHAPALNRAPQLPVMPPFSNTTADEQPVRSIAAALASANQTATVEALFGNQDYCLCSDCASMYSPSAYLVELLQMLDGGSRKAGLTALDVLLRRRPDLAELELNCDNTSVEVPYIDLVLERLESLVAEEAYPENTFARGLRDSAGVPKAWGFDPVLDAGQLPQQLNDDLARVGITVGDSPAVTALPSSPADKRWRVSGGGWRLQLRGQENPARLRLTVYPQSQAGTSPDQAVPREYVRWAYTPLLVARFPWALPFDIHQVETEAWLGRPGSSRREVVETYLDADPWSSLAAACAVLGLSNAERRRLMEPTTQPWLDWGLPSEWLPGENGSQRQWYPQLRVVSEFRRRARISHPELLQLLDSSFFQSAPGHMDPIVLTGDECNSDLMMVGDSPISALLVPATLRRAYLFVRLARRLGWAFHDLDAAIRAHGHAVEPVDEAALQANLTAESFTASFLLYLANLVRLRELTRLPLEVIINIFRSTLDNVPRWDYSGTKPVRVGSYCERLLHDPVVSRPRAPGLELTPAGNELVSLAPSATVFPRLRLVDYATELSAALSCRPGDVAAVLAPAGESILPANLGAGGATHIEGDWVDISTAEDVKVEWQVGYPSDDTTRARVILQELDASGSPVDTASVVEVGRGSNDWRHTVTTYAGTSTRLRVRVERIAGTGTLWVAARILSGSGLVEERLTLASLTKLCGHLRLARGAKIATRDYVALVQMSGIDPLLNPAEALRFLDASRVAQSSGLKVDQLDLLLRRRYPNQADETKAGRITTELLTSFRERMQAAEATLRATPDNAADLTRQLLVEIGWPNRLVDRLLGGDGLGRLFPTTFDAWLKSTTRDLASVLPPGLSFANSTLTWTSRPGTAATQLSAAAANLRATQEYAALTTDDRAGLDTALDALTAKTAEVQQQVADAVDTVFDLARSLELPTHGADYPAGSVPTGEAIEIPPEWKGTFWFDPGSSRFHFVGPMTREWRDALAELGGTPASSPYRATIDKLFATARSHTEVPPNQLISRGSNPPPAPSALLAERMVDELTSLSERCAQLLDVIVPVVRERRAAAIIRRLVADSYGLTLEQSHALVERFRHTEGSVTYPLVTRQRGQGWLVARSFVDSDPAVEINAASFPAQVHALDRLAMFALAVAGCRLSEAETGWLLGGWDGAAGQFDFSSLPLQRLTGAAPLWSTWLALATLLEIPKRSHLERSALESVRAALSEPTDETARFGALANVLGIASGELSLIAPGVGASSAAQLLDPSRLSRLARTAALMRRTGADATTLDLWRAVPSATGAARARQLARATIGELSWAAAAKPTFDSLRRQRRDALVEYWVHRYGLRDANDLYGLLLMDSQMSPCAVTTRIRQAISTVQLFIQRVVMSLEPEVRADAIDPDQWAWMKNYRVWEANRKVLLYPENWIEPDLRPDKTMPFETLTSEFSQGDVTADTADAALRTYVDGLADIARLQVVGMCCDYDDKERLTTVHLFGRTRSEPYAYYYRRFDKRQPEDTLDHGGDWSAWEPLPVEVEGDHLVPFIWQGRMFLLWPIFGEHAATPASGGTSEANQQPQKLVTMKIAWSEYRHHTWTRRKVFGDDVLRGAQLSTSEWLAREIYLRPAPQELGVAIHVYLGGTRPTRNDIAKFPLDKLPVVTLYFDGEELRTAAGLAYVPFNVSAAGPLTLIKSTPGAYYFDVEKSTNPIVVDATTLISKHDGMALLTESNPLSLSNPLGLPNTQVEWPVLTKAPRRRTVLLPASEPRLLFRAPSPLRPGLSRPTLPFIYMDVQRQFFIYPTVGIRIGDDVNELGLVVRKSIDSPKVHITALDHVHIGRFRRVLRYQGVKSLLSITTQTEPTAPKGVRGGFAKEYLPNTSFVATQPDDDVVFSPTEPAGPYNWELFYHAPVAIAASLARNHRFAQAQEWFHYVFNPTDPAGADGPAGYWQFRPFRELGAGIAIPDLARRLADPSDSSPEKRALLTTITQWRENPFEPHLVARLRPRAYLYCTVMKYLDNLIAWGDQLFRRDSMESIDEATQIYVLAAQILGRKPEAVMHRTRARPMAFAELRPQLNGGAGGLGNPLVVSENIAGTGGGTVRTTRPLPLSLYFCVPENPKLREYYATVEDRLNKIRNCMNIDGVERSLALFDPPIDPGMLVRARAAGVDIAAILADANAPLPLYRFSTMSQKATSLASEVRELGGALLSAMEKRDGEALARLRSSHELSALASLRLSKELQVQEARAHLEALGPALENAQARLAYYVGLVSQVEDLTIPNGPAGPTIASIAAAAVETIATTLEVTQAILAPIAPFSSAATGLLKQALSRAAEALNASVPEAQGTTSKVPMNDAERRNLEELKAARDEQAKGFDRKAAARLFTMTPDVTLGSSGMAGSPVVTAQIGGSLLSKAAELFALQSEGASVEHSHRGNLASILASYQRRAADWVHQAGVASRDIDQLVKQAAAATIRISIANQELRNHDLASQNAKEADSFLHDKATNQELYGWMLQRASDVYFRSYQLAYDVAKRAEQTYRYELGLETSDFIKFGYWDSMRRGLGAGEQLLHDLRRMEVAYLNDNRRELEITKHVSLRQIDGAALLRLRAEGVCEFEVPEALFDIDFAGHYFRRLKSVGVSVPCVVGPYTGVNGTLTLLSSSVRTSSVVVDRYDARENYSTRRTPVQQIATSSGQNDSGLFELSFGDARYLPFEGAGAVSRWRFTLPKDFRAFDYSTITDLVMHLRYTARDGGELLGAKARESLADRLNALTHQGSAEPGMVQILSLRMEYPHEWQQFKEGQPLVLQFTDQQFPYLFTGRVQPQGAALVSVGAGPGAVLEEVEPAEWARGAFRLAYDAGSPLLADKDPYVVVTYTIAAE